MSEQEDRTIGQIALMTMSDSGTHIPLVAGLCQHPELGNDSPGTGSREEEVGGGSLAI